VAGRPFLERRHLSLHHMERNAHLSAIRKAIGALSEARIVLSQATHRLGDPK
jgi:hypothetical protein